jgi:hypothetical protein
LASIARSSQAPHAMGMAPASPHRDPFRSAAPPFQRPATPQINNNPALIDFSAAPAA